MDVLIKLIVIIILQGISISSDHVILPKYTQLVFVDYTSVKVEKNKQVRGGPESCFTLDCWGILQWHLFCLLTRKSHSNIGVGPASVMFKVRQVILICIHHWVARLWVLHFWGLRSGVRVSGAGLCMGFDGRGWPEGEYGVSRGPHSCSVYEGSTGRGAWSEERCKTHLLVLTRSLLFLNLPCSRGNRHCIFHVPRSPLWVSSLCGW